MNTKVKIDIDAAKKYIRNLSTEDSVGDCPLWVLVSLAADEYLRSREANKSSDEEYQNIILKIPREKVSDLLLMLNSAICFANEYASQLSDEESARVRVMVTSINDEIIFQSPH